MAPVERKTVDFVAEITASNECLNSESHDKANDFLEKDRAFYLDVDMSYLVYFYCFPYKITVK